MQSVLDLVKPLPDAKWVVFYSLGEGADKGVATTRTRSSP